MSSQVSLPVSSSQDIIRPISNFVPAIWGDRFLNYEPENLEKQLVKEKEVEKLKEEVKNMFLWSKNYSFHQLKLIDDIQRLGVAYHFEREIKETLENIYAAYFDCRLNNDFIDLNYVSLCFRLLRQQGINISSDVFNKFKDENGTFKESLATDVEGLLSLYEASYLGVRGEVVLDEALLFSTTHLEAFLKQESSILSNMVSKALHRPLRKSLARVNATHFISIYKDLPSFNETLLRFAVLDSNLLQSMHKNELSDLTKWSCETANDLPEYMKIFYKMFLDLFKEIEESMVKQRTSYRMFYAKEQMTIQIQSNFDEAKWRNEKNTPTIEEYLFVSTTSSGYAIISTICFVCMAVVAVVEEDFQWLSNQPKILKATELICRLMDDIVSYKRERETGFVAMAIECYTTQHGTTEEEAIRVLNNWVSEAWKDINQELLQPICVKMDLLLPILHMTQVMDELYKEEDSYTIVRNYVKEGISVMFINPVSP